MMNHPDTTRTLTIHVGMPKTGSSAIQVALARNTEELLRRGVLYPDHPSLSMARKGHITSGNGRLLAPLLGILVSPDLEQVKARIRRHMKRARGQGLDLLYSSERLLGLDISSLSEFNEFITSEGFDLKIVVYVRSIADYAVSYYQQIIKRRMYSGTFEDWLRDHNLTAFDKIIDIHNSLDSNHLIVRNYDEVRNNLIPDFFSNILGLKDVSGLDVNIFRTNRSLTETEALILRTLNQSFTDPVQSKWVSDTLINREDNISYTPFVLQSELDILQTKYSAVVESINRIGPNFPIGIKSSRLELTALPRPRLTEAETVLSRLVAQLISSVVNGRLGLDEES